MSPISSIFKRNGRDTAAAVDQADRSSDDLSSSNEGAKAPGSFTDAHRSWSSKVPQEELLGAKESLLHTGRKQYSKMRSSYV